MKKQLGAFLVSLVLIGAAGAQQAVDAWAPQGSQQPIWLVVNDPVRGVVPFPPVHATLLPDGRVMMFASTGNHARAAWFRPTGLAEPLPPYVMLTGDHVPVDVDPPFSYTDPAGNRVYIEETLFCSGHTLMADGSIFVAGGTLLVSLYEAATETTANWIYGMPNVTRYSFATGTWSRGEDMRGLGASGSNLRWYGTVTRLADQRMLISSGYTLAMLQVIPRPPQAPQHHLGVKNLSVEVMLPAGGGKVVSTHQETPEEVWNPDYTHAFQVPYGPPLVPPNMVLMFGEAGVPVYFFPDNPQGARWFTQSDARRPGATTSAGAPNHGAASVMLPMRALNGEWGYMNGSILQAGGGKESDMEKSIDFYEIGSSGWGQSLNLGVPRRYPATVLLPDGKVMVISGYDRTYQNPFLRNAHYLNMRPPLSPDTFTTGTAASGETRGYHNVALLLPDGRVLIAGGRSKGSDLDHPSDEKPSFRYLYPPYLSPIDSPRARPTITAGPDTIGYGSSFTLQVSGGPVSEVVLMGLGSMTHAFDMNQRYVQLAAMPQGTTGALVTGPANIETAPPGYYMLFVLNQDRIPSIARFVRVVP